MYELSNKKFRTCVGILTRNAQKNLSNILTAKICMRLHKVTTKSDANIISTLIFKQRFQF